jgi:hypothetical protein
MREEDIKNIVKTMSDFVNSFGSSSNNEGFARLMGCEHRTLQQNFTRLCTVWFEHLSKVKNRRYDLRNEASVKLAKKFVEKLKDDIYLPHV